MSFKPLGEIVSVKGGKRLPKGSTLQEEPNSHPYIRVKDMGSRYIPRSGLEFVPEDVFPKISRYTVNTNDVIISIVGTIGLISVIDEFFDNASQTENCAKLSGLDKVDALYLYYFLRSDIGQAEIKMGTVGAVQAKLPLYNIEKLNVYWPIRKIREKIVCQLSTIDDKLELNTQTNQTLEQIAQAIFKSWFVDFDPVKAKMNGEQPNGMDTATASLFPEKLVESELGLIPEGWQVGALSSVVDVVMGQSPKGSTYNDQNEGTPLVNGPVEFGVYHPVAQKWTTAPTKMSKNKDLIVCVRGSTTGRYVVSDGEYCLGRGVCSIRSNDFPSFASYLFKSELNSLLHLTTGSTFPSWSGPTLKNFKVVVPPEAIIEKFELLIGKLCEMMARNIGQNETLSTLRDTLLPKLLSGEIDLNSEVVA
ncbi:restriction endonuclease subunit S [Vibrio vulnificus]|uniref:restriction endonuclease subunit S n=1 Tax=Vibrio vulnificus TaxID=672 RepID=UPI001CDBD1C2|nr:restriction endonuclease subunit S [Vibrio vulnificus]MCA3938408.1 restriction endonuclease subunit S [Vibrio vulnificus]